MDGTGFLQATLAASGMPAGCTCSLPGTIGHGTWWGSVQRCGRGRVDGARRRADDDELNALVTGKRRVLRATRWEGDRGAESRGTSGPRPQTDFDLYLYHYDTDPGGSG